jgi:peptidyl-prolyl cis-trans isomerase B (cyclophilin B)
MRKILLLAAVAVLASCGGKQEKLVKIKTSLGDMTVLLYDETPLHKANFLELAESGKYDSTIFHRVIQNFMIQGGDLFKGKGPLDQDTSRIAAEFVEGFYHKKGELAAARQPDQVNPEKKSSNCQFYIVQGRVWSEEELTVDQARLNQGIGQLLQTGNYDSLQQQFVQLQMQGMFDEMNALAMAQRSIVEQEFGIDLTVDFPKDRLDIYTTTGGYPFLDGEYTIFGRVVEGLDVIDKIATVEKGQGDVPVDPINVTMEIVKMSKGDVTSKYGYTYPTKK